MKNSQNQTGFNLIELMIVIGVLAILAAIAIPAYTEQVRKTRRNEARKELLQIAAAQERFLTNCGIFAPTMAGAQATCTGLGGVSPRTTEHGTYRISMSAVTATTWTLTAVPQGAQALDTKCANLTLTHLAVKGRSGTAPIRECW